MKKAIFVVFLVSLLLWGCKKEPSVSAYVQRMPSVSPKVEPNLPSSEFLGEKTTVELTYRGITGMEDDYGVGGGWGFGTARSESSFIKAVKQQTKHSLFISRNHYLFDREHTAIEYDRKEILYAYFDLNGDGQFSGDERLNPASDVAERNRRGKDCTVFITPDFMIKDGFGEKVPFRVMLWVTFYGRNKTPNVTWSPLGVYEGRVDLHGQLLTMHLWPNFSSRSYTQYGRSSYSLIPESQTKDQYISKSTFSSLIVHEKKFYRVTLGDVTSNQTIKVNLIEDKTLRGKFEFAVKSTDALKSNLSYARLHGEKDQTIHYRIRGGMQDLPIGDYTISYGNLRYGREKDDEYSTTFRKIPSFSIFADQTTTVEIGQPQLKVQAVVEKERYRVNKTYRSEFSRKETIYIDASFVGVAKETYDGFEKRIKQTDYYRYESVKADIKIVSNKGKVVINQALEYG